MTFVQSMGTGHLERVGKLTSELETSFTKVMQIVWTKKSGQDSNVKNCRLKIEEEEGWN